MLKDIKVKTVRLKNKDGSYRYEERLYNTARKVAIKNADGSAVLNADGSIAYKYVDKVNKAKEPRFVKEIVRYPVAKDSKLRVSPAEWEKMELEQKGRKLREECGAKRRELEAEYEALYKKYPQIKPAQKTKPKKVEEGDVPCSSSVFAACKSAVYRYPSGNQKIVITEKLPVVKKEKKVKKQQTSKKYKWKRDGYKGVSDDGCGCYL